MAHDGLGAHARDELAISEKLKARPVQAAAASAASFSMGAGRCWSKSLRRLHPPRAVAVASLAALAVLGGLAQK
jgi:hypothetical protein